MSVLLRRWIDAALAVPLACKLVAASVAVAALVAGAALAAVRHVAATPAIPEGALIAAAFGVGAALLALVNGLLVHLALRPIRELERAAGRAVERREEERRELARRLQEDVAQRVAACLLKLKVARAPADDAERDARLDELREEAASVLESVRRIARDLHPPELADVGVGRAIQAFSRSFTESTGIEVEVDLEPVNGALDEEARLSLYRIAQDLLVNVVQRAECRAVRVRLRASPGRVTLELSGRGEGRVAPVLRADSPELAEIRERAGYAGGRSRIRVELPAAADDGGAARAVPAG